MKNKKRLSLSDFFKLPIKEQENIVSGVAAMANKDQLDLVKRYDKKFGKAKVGNCCQFCDCK
ncbi:hypothetical protein KAS41_01960 [Candidatus Parcubacteria bacterium]|nr:hypothetical protein [Candidatus Parcubacteria bacterium]